MTNPLVVENKAVIAGPGGLRQQFFRPSSSPGADHRRGGQEATLPGAEGAAERKDAGGRRAGGLPPAGPRQRRRTGPSWRSAPGLAEPPRSLREDAVPQVAAGPPASWPLSDGGERNAMIEPLASSSQWDVVPPGARVVRTARTRGPQVSRRDGPVQGCRPAGAGAGPCRAGTGHAPADPAPTGSATTQPAGGGPPTTGPATAPTAGSALPAASGAGATPEGPLGRLRRRGAPTEGQSHLGGARPILPLPEYRARQPGAHSRFAGQSLTLHAGVARLHRTPARSTFPSWYWTTVTNRLPDESVEVPAGLVAGVVGADRRVPGGGFLLVFERVLGPPAFMPVIQSFCSL